MIIGNLTYDPSEDSYRGSIRTLLIDRLDIELRPARRNGERDPDYRIVGEDEAGTVELGAAWSKRSEKGQNYLSVTLDDPSLPRSLQAALFTDDHGEATLVWNRPRRENPSTEPDRPAAKGRRAGAGRSAKADAAP